jgi:hypothetical protein
MALINRAGLTKADWDENRLDDRFNSSRVLNSSISSGNVIRLFPDKSRIFNRAILKRLRILVGLIKLKLKFRFSSLGKSSFIMGGIEAIMLY